MHLHRRQRGGKHRSKTGEHPSARGERTPPRHANGSTTAKHLPARCHRCGFCSAGTQAQRSPTPRISFRFVPSHRFRQRPPARGRSTADTDTAQHPPSPTDTPRHQRPGLHHTASRALGGQAMDPRRRHPGRTWARASESVRRTTMNVASLRSHSLKSHPTEALNKA